MTTGLSTLEKTVFDYQHTDPQNISFRGSFFKYRTQENVAESKYDFHKGDGHYENVVRLNNRVVTESEALYIPQIRDMGGLKTERQVTLLTALGVLDPMRVYFVPDAKISRHDFAKAVYIAIKGELPAPKKNDIMKRRRAGVETPFLDINVDHPDYHYIEAYKREGLIIGRNKYLKPDEPITKAEAMAIVMRATGLDKVAPIPPYKTVYVDDAGIPEWSKDAFYMALEIGLVGGEDTASLIVRSDSGLHANAMEYLSKEQAAVLIERLIHHLNETLIPDYREKVIKN